MTDVRHLSLPATLLHGPRASRGEDGYAMAALLVSLSIMAVLMTAVMPTWRQMAQREKEAELIYRGQQYTRAIGLFQRKNGPGTLPPNVEVLVQQHFLRKPYKDPITNDDFDLLRAGQVVGAQGQPGSTPSAQTGAASSGVSISSSSGLGAGGIMGVVSKSKAESIKIYNGRTHYNEWAFIFNPPAAAPGGGGAGGGRGGQPQGPGGQGVGGGVGGRGGRGGDGRGGPGRGGPFGPPGGPGTFGPGQGGGRGAPPPQPFGGGRGR